ncbi:MAG: hypothetical protein AB7P49_08990 [Bdellovibrionales bacterium]
MIRKRILLILLVILSGTGAAGPILVGNGAGESEFSLLFARLRLPSLLAMCDGICELNPGEQVLLSELKARGDSPPEAVFQGQPQLGGRMYVLRFGKKTEVWFNSDELWLDQAKTKPIEIPQAVSLWMEILAATAHPDSSTPPLPSSDFRSLQAKLELALGQSLRRVPAVFEKELVFEALLWAASPSGGRLFLRNSEYVADELTSHVREALACPVAPEGLRFHSLRWTEVSRHESGELSLQMDLTQTWLCDGRAQRGRVKLVFRTTSRPPYGVEWRTVRVFLEGE